MPICMLYSGVSRKTSFKRLVWDRPLYYRKTTGGCGCKEPQTRGCKVLQNKFKEKNFREKRITKFVQNFQRKIRSKNLGLKI